MEGMVWWRERRRLRRSLPAKGESNCLGEAIEGQQTEEKSSMKIIPLGVYGGARRRNNRPDQNLQNTMRCDDVIGEKVPLNCGLI